MLNDWQRMKISIIGGIPSPIGGVTNFIFRAAEQDKRVRQVFDFYPEGEKLHLTNANHICCQLRLATYFLLFVSAVRFSKRIFHLNTSSLTGLLFFFPLVLILGKRLRFTAHHGNLSYSDRNLLLRLLIRNALKRIGVIYALSSKQLIFYKDLVGSENVELVSSYIRPSVVRAASKCDRFCICLSGYPSRVYNFDRAIELFKNNTEYEIHLFLYGTGDNEDYLSSLVNKYPNICIYWNTDSDTFLGRLSSSNLYLRLNSVDSFGIACAEAISLGVPVIATDVCERYDGCYLVNCDANNSLLYDAISLMKKGRNPHLPISKAGISEFHYD